MPLWLDAILIVVLALLIDRYIGEVPNSVHPLRWMGNMLAAIDRHVRSRQSWKAIAAGFLSYLLVFAVFCGVGLCLTSLVRYGVSSVDPLAGEICWIVLTALLFKINFAIFSFRKHTGPICEDLEKGDLESADARVQMIVSRDTRGMDAEHVASSCCETVTENLVDSVYSPLLYFGIFGLPGAVMFRCANLMDAMWGYLNERYANIGHFPARFDDVLGFVTSRVSPYFIALAGMMLGMDWRAAVPAAKKDHRMTPSPNSGWSMTATAAVLGIGMEKRGVYFMNPGHPLPTTDDVRRCCRLIELASMIFLLTVCLILYGTIGIGVQLWCEDAVFGFWGSVF